MYYTGFPGGLDGKESAYNARDLDQILGLGRSPEEMATHSISLTWRIPWREESGRLQSMGSQSGMTEQLTHTHTHIKCLGNNDLHLLGIVYKQVSKLYVDLWDFIFNK